MVRIRIVSRYIDNCLGPDATSRAIAGGPLYPAAEVLQLLVDNGGGCISAWTRKCVADLQELVLDADDLAELLGKAVTDGRFIGAEWCRQEPDGPWAACDAYTLSRREWSKVARRELEVEYYLKFAIARSGKVLLLVSCHLS